MSTPLFNLSQCKRILCLGAHADDIEIGCGGSILRILETVPNVEFYWYVFSATANRRVEAQRSANAFLQGAKHSLQVLQFEDGRMPFNGNAVKDAFLEIRRELLPDLVMTHRLEDRHQDHRLLAELTWQTFRDHMIWEYEVPKYEGDLGQPNLHVVLQPQHAQRKLDLLIEHFPSQASKHWFSRDTFQSLMRLRAVEAGGDAQFAESFAVRKVRL